MPRAFRRDASVPGLIPSRSVEASAFIQKFMAGERAVFRDLIRAYERAYYRQAFSVVRNHSELTNTNRD